MVIWVAGTMFKDLGHSDSEITIATREHLGGVVAQAVLAAFLDMYRTKKFFVLAMEFVMAALLAGIAASLRLPKLLRVVHHHDVGRGVCVSDAGHLHRRRVHHLARQIEASGVHRHPGHVVETWAASSPRRWWCGFAGSLKARGYETKTRG